MSNEMTDRLPDKAADRARLAKALWCCDECGEYWGTPPPDGRPYQRHMGYCDVCLAVPVPVSHVRVWGWLTKREGRPG